MYALSLHTSRTYVWGNANALSWIVMVMVAEAIMVVRIIRRLLKKPTAGNPPFIYMFVWFSWLFSINICLCTVIHDYVYMHISMMLARARVFVCVCMCVLNTQSHIMQHIRENSRFTSRRLLQSSSQIMILPNKSTYLPSQINCIYLGQRCIVRANAHSTILSRAVFMAPFGNIRSDYKGPISLQGINLFNDGITDLAIVKTTANGVCS